MADAPAPDAKCDPRRDPRRDLRPEPGELIGLLGGSFNPAHDGHRHVSEMALERLALDRVWWLVSPQNPLKPETGMASLDERMQSCRAVAGGDARIVVTDVECRLGTRLTAETLTKLLALYPEQRFVWLMGADNLIQIDAWADWRAIFEAVPIAVFARPSYSSKALSSKAAGQFDGFRIDADRAAELAGMPPPAWVFLDIPMHPASATRIRAARRP